jgi:hypothetical protein
MPGLTHAETIAKLLLYTAGIFIAPYVAYRAAADHVLPAAHARYGWDAIADDGGRSVWSGAAAILAVNAVLVAYVASAMREENGFGGNVRVDREKRE